MNNDLDSNYIKAVLYHYKKTNKRIAFTNGCFDLMHPGHYDFFDHISGLKYLFDVLIIGLNSDISIKKIKGEERPIYNQRTRKEMLSRTHYNIDLIIIFNEETPLELLKIIQPNILFKGEDWKGKIPQEEIELVKEIIYIHFERPGFSTTKLIEKIKGI